MGLERGGELERWGQVGKLMVLQYGDILSYCIGLSRCTAGPFGAFVQTGKWCPLFWVDLACVAWQAEQRLDFRPRCTGHNLYNTHKALGLGLGPPVQRAPDVG